jgi:hypothetical protein
MRDMKASIKLYRSATASTCCTYDRCPSPWTAHTEGGLAKAARMKTEAQGWPTKAFHCAKVRLPVGGMLGRRTLAALYFTLIAVSCRKPSLNRCVTQRLSCLRSVH